MKKMIKNIFLKWFFNILNIYIIFTIIYSFCLNSNDKAEYVIHIRSLKQELNHELFLKKVHRVIKFQEKSWLKSSIDMNTDLRKNLKNDFEEDFCKLMNNVSIGKTIKKVRKYRDIKLVTIERWRNYFASEPVYHTAKFFTENLLATETKKRRSIWIKKTTYT